MYYYQFNIPDYRADTAHLSIVEHGIYRQLLDWYYLDEQPIPKITQVVMRRLCLGSEHQHFLDNVLSDFFILSDNGYHHARVEQELEHYRAQFAKNRVNGKLGGRPRKTQVVSDKTQVVSKNNHMATQTKPQLITNNQELITNNINTLSVKTDAEDVLDYLNLKANKRFKPVKSNIAIIKARLNEHSAAELRQMIEDRCSQWLNDEKMVNFLRPETLFNATKCAGYVGALGSVGVPQWAKGIT